MCDYVVDGGYCLCYWVNYGIVVVIKVEYYHCWSRKKSLLLLLLQIIRGSVYFHANLSSWVILYVIVNYTTTWGYH